MLNLLSEEAIAPEKMNHDRKMASGETAHRRRRRGTQKLSGKRTDSGRYSEKVGHPPVHRRCNLSLHGGGNLSGYSTGAQSYTGSFVSFFAA